MDEELRSIVAVEGGRFQTDCGKIYCGPGVSE